MKFLETNDIKRPVLFETDNEVSQEFETTINKLVEDRNQLTANHIAAKDRSLKIPGEIEALNIELSKTLDKKMRNELKDSIEQLEIEYAEVKEVLSLDTKAIMMDKFADSKAYALEEGARAEYARWMKEINEYETKLRNQLSKTKGNLRYIEDRNIYKTTKTNLDNLEKSLRE